MELYSTEPTIFSDYSIAEGPRYIEALFDLLTPQNTDGGNVYLKYLHVLEELMGEGDAEKQKLLLFYQGYCLQKLAKASPDNNGNLSKKSLLYYEAFLRDPAGPSEIHYYAQWQVGLLQESLNHPWTDVETALLKATSIDPLRGEAHTKIIRHYLTESDWPQAYLHNSYAREHFYNNDPAQTRTWEVEPSCYNWRVLDKQITICYMLGLKNKVKECLNELFNYLSFRRKELSTKESDYIEKKLDPWMKRYRLCLFNS